MIRLKIELLQTLLILTLFEPRKLFVLESINSLRLLSRHSHVQKPKFALVLYGMCIAEDLQLLLIVSLNILEIA